MMAVPLIVLYEISILVSKMARKKKKEKEEAPEEKEEG
jgi:Sec-independent protein secretion pathway component TatC